MFNIKSGVVQYDPSYQRIDPVPSTSTSTDGDIVINKLASEIPTTFISENDGYDSNEDPEYDPSELDPHENESSENADVQKNIFTQSQNEDNAIIETPNPNNNGLAPRKRCKRKQPQKWAMNIRKKAKNLVQNYKTTTGTIRGRRKPKNLQIACPCSLKCNEKITDGFKEILCRNFWEIDNIDRQRDYIISNVSRKESVRSRKENSRRKFSQIYSFIIDGIKHKVCKPFFLQTLDISEKFVRIAFEKAKRSRTGVPSPDRRGKHAPGIKLAEESKQFAINHIDSFPRVPAHWCRKDTKKEYLEAILNRTKTYDLYKDHCAENHKKPISFALYKELLIKKNISFHVPRKDQCWCHHFEKLPEIDKRQEKIDEYNLHLRRKIAANTEKANDAQKAKENIEYLSANFDLQAVLYSPLLHAKPIFYKRKLATFNFTVYDVSRKQGYCFIWPEFEGKRGANEIASCVKMFIDELPKKTTHVVLHSDCCPGQNRNAIMVYMLYQAVQTIKHIQIIDLKFLEPGHTHMQCDSIHATIEHASEYAKIYWPNDWINVIKLAAKKKPFRFRVKVLNHTSFINYKELQQKFMTINSRNTKEHNSLNWKTVKWIRVEKSKPKTLLYKNEYWEEDFSVLKTSRKGRNSKESSNDVPNTLPLYSTKLPIKKVKYDSLLSMCQGRDAIIPPEYRDFYSSLPLQNNLQESENEESDDEMTLQHVREQLITRKRHRNK